MILACLLVSFGINLGVVVSSVALLRANPSDLPPTAALNDRARYCGDIHKELADLVVTGRHGAVLSFVLGDLASVPERATTPLTGGRLLLELRDVVFGPECNDEAMMVALVEPEIRAPEEEPIDWEELEPDPPEPIEKPKP